MVLRSVIRGNLSRVIVGAGFEPLSLNPTEWWDGRKEVTEESLAVAEWADKLGNGSSWTQGVEASQLTYDPRGFLFASTGGENMGGATANLSKTWTALAFNLDWTSASSIERVVFSFGGLGGGAGVRTPWIAYQEATGNIFVQWRDSNNNFNQIDFDEGVEFNNGDNIHIVMYWVGTELTVNLNGFIKSLDNGFAEVNTNSGNILNDTRTGTVGASTGQIICGVEPIDANDAQNLVNYLETITNTWGF